MTKRILASLTLAFALGFPTSPARAGLVLSFDDILFWGGSGPNRTALVVDWNDGVNPESIAWGYLWDDSAPTVFDMVVGLAASNSGLFARIDSATNFGPGIFGLGYGAGPGAFGVAGALDHLGNAVAVTFTNGISDTNTNGTSTQAPVSSVAALPVHASDHYKEGWFDNGFWELYDGAPGSSLPESWTSNFAGATSTLVPDGWFAFSITSANYTSNIPAAPTAAIPEPAALPLAGAAFGLLATRRTRRTARLAAGRNEG